MEDFDSNVLLKEKLLAAGIDEITAHGVKDFSLRRVAAACGASCAAPYKHFKNKDEFIQSIIAYVEGKWARLCDQITLAFPDPRERIPQLCAANVKFRLANPLYGTDSDPFDPVLRDEILRLCESNGLWAPEKRIYIISALVAGTAVLLEKGAVPNQPATYNQLMEKISVELW